MRIAGSAQAYPNPKKPKRPADNVAAFFKVLWKKLVYTGLTALCYVLWEAVLLASNIGGLGFGQRIYLFWVTIAPLTT